MCLKRIFKVILLNIVVILSFSVVAQIPAAQRVTATVKEGRLLERALFITPKGEGEYMIGGLSMKEFPADGQMFLMAAGNDFTTRWKKYYGTSGFDFPFSITALNNREYLVTGFRRAEKRRDLDCWVLKLNDKGDTLWTTTWGSTGDDRAYRAAVTPSGNYIVVSQSGERNNLDGQLTQFSPEGERHWQRNFGDTLLDRTYNVLSFPDGSIVVSGITNENYPGNSDILVFRVDQSGELMWTRTFGGEKGDIAHAMISGKENTFYIIGYSADKSFPLADPLVLEINLEGEQVRKFSVQTGYDIKLMNGYRKEDGSVIVAGFIRDSLNEKSDVVFGRLNTRDGTFQLQRYSCGPEDEEVYDILPAGPGKSILVGHTYSTGTKDGDVLILEWMH